MALNWDVGGRAGGAGGRGQGTRREIKTFPSLQFPKQRSLKTNGLLAWGHVSALSAAVCRLLQLSLGFVPADSPEQALTRARGWEGARERTRRSSAPA